MSYLNNYEVGECIMQHQEQYPINEDLNKAPCRVGDVIRESPTGKSKEDPFLSYHGYIIFIKGMPQEYLESVIVMKVTAVKPRFGFAQFIGVDER